MLIAGRYEVENEVARGASSILYRARNRDGSIVALKVLNQENSGSSELSRNEFALLSGMTHPNLVRLLDIGRDPETDRHFLAMEFVQGVPLSQALDRTDESRTLAYMIQAARALGFIHSRGVVHRDIKPGNLLVRPDETLKLVDFGLAVRSAQPDRAAAGTLLYLAPEILEGYPADPRSDLYSLGLAFAHAVIGTPPFSAENSSDLLKQILQGEIQGALLDALPEIVGPTIRRLSHRRPEARFQCAADLIRHLDLVAVGGLPLELLESKSSHLVSPVMAGRSAPMARMAGVLQELSRGSVGPETPPLFLLGGDAGIGKSRFIAEVRREAVVLGLDTILIQCSDAPSPPLHPIAVALRALAPRSASSHPGHVQLPESVAMLLSAEEIPGEDVEAPERRMSRERSRVLDQITGYFLERASEHRLVLIFEDVHWVDEASLDLLRYLARNACGSQLVIVASHRAESEVTHEFAEWLATTTRKEWCERIELQRLGEDEVRQVIGSVFEGAVVDSALVRTLTRESGGNPLFLLEILRSLHDDRSVSRTDSGWQLPEADTIRSAIPEDLDRALSRRLGQARSATEKTILGALSIMGRPLGPETIADLAELPSEEVESGLRALVDRGLLTRSAWAGGRFSFEHALVRRAAEESIPPQERVRLHRRAGELLERDAPDAPGAIDEIARHYAEGGPKDRAVRYAEKAGELALARHAGADAAAHFERAMALLDPSEHEAAQALMLKAGNSRLAAGDYVQATDRFEKLVMLLERSTNLSLRARALERLGTVLGFQKSGEEGIAHVRDALTLFRELGDLTGEARALHNLAIRHARQSRYAEALPLLHAALQIQETRGDISAMADERNSVGLVECFLGRYDSAAEHLEQAFVLARSTDYRYLMGAARHNLGIVRRSQGRPDAALACAREARAIFEEIGHRQAYGLAVINVGLYCRAVGRYQEALETFRHARLAVARAGDTSREVYALESEADLLRFLGQPLTAVDRLMEGIRVALRAGDERQHGYATAALSRALLDSGRVPEALERARSALELGEKTACPRLIARSLVALASGNLADTLHAEAAARARELLVRASQEAPLEEMVVEANLILASALHELSDPEGASVALREARTTISARSLGALAPLADRIEARIARRAGDEAGARALDRRAADARRALSNQITDEALRRSFETAITFEWPRETVSQGWGAPSGTTAMSALRTLYEITSLVSSGHSLDEILDRVLDLTLETVGAARGLIILVDERSGEFQVRTSRGIERQTARDATRYSRGIVRAAGEGQSILTLDAQNDDRFTSFRSISLFQIKSLMCVPLRVRGGTIGTVYVDGGKGGRIFTPDDLSFLEAFANQAAIAIENARMYSELAEENRRLKQEVVERHRYDNFVGESPEMRKIFDLMERAAPSPLPVLIQGESGTGKELVARALHFNSPRQARNFLSENCAAIPEPLLESELFGYVQGAFTGADRNKKGLYEMADGGTLFLDEIGEMPFGMQSKLLRVLQEGEFRPIGGKEVRRASVRVVAATNADLKQRIAEGRFRQDLYYRLNVISIVLPPLRSRREDIPRLARFFLGKEAIQRQVKDLSIDDDLLALLVRYSWPGNVRQLQNVISRLAVLARSTRIAARDLELDPQLMEQLAELDPSDRPLEDLETLERRQIMKALQLTSGNREKAALMLGIGRATIFRKLKDYGIS